MGEGFITKLLIKGRSDPCQLLFLVNDCPKNAVFTIKFACFLTKTYTIAILKQGLRQSKASFYIQNTDLN